jgi:hypothetical protein
MDLHGKDVVRGGGAWVRQRGRGPWGIQGVPEPKHAPPGVSPIATLINATNRLAVITRRPGRRASACVFGQLGFPCMEGTS